MEQEAAVDVRGLRKAYGNEDVLKGLDLRVEQGTVYGVLGPNGAGKTTLISILSTLLAPDSGSVRIFGLDVVREADAVRRRIGLTGQFAAVDEGMSGRDNLVLFGRLAGYSAKTAKVRAEQLLDAFGLTDAAGRSAGKYSGACGGGWILLRRCSSPRTFCFWTNRRPVWIRGAAAKCGISCALWWTMAQPWC